MNRSTKQIAKLSLPAMLAVILALSFAGGGVLARAAKTDASPSKPAKARYIPIPAGEYTIDPAHTVVGFAVRHLEIALVEGRFKDLSGAIRVNPDDVTQSGVSFRAKIESIDTGVAQRDNHLRTADFFDAAKYPEMTFTSTKVERKSKTAYVIHGDLTLKGVTKRISFPFTLAGAVKDPWGNTRFGVEARTKIDRRDYGITYGNPLAGGGIDVGNEVTIVLHLEAFLPGPKPTGSR